MTWPFPLVYLSTLCMVMDTEGTWGKYEPHYGNSISIAALLFSFGNLHKIRSNINSKNKQTNPAIYNRSEAI